MAAYKRSGAVSADDTHSPISTGKGNKPMLNLNSTTLAAVVEKAAHDAVDHPRWLTAIGRAILELDSNPYLERNDHGGLIIGSPSGNVYAANGVCQCEGRLSVRSLPTR
jgi:hypothetical protein